jgi:flagellin-like protein
MKTTTTSERQRKAISPIIATVLIIAVTLIAAVAIGGFVFGLFGASSNTAQVSAVNAALAHPTAVGTFAAACAASAPASTPGFIQLSNTGSANTVVTSFSLTYGGNTYSVAPTGGTLCTVTGGVTIYMTIVTATGYPAIATTGQQFTGFVVTANGAQVVFTGAFS